MLAVLDLQIGACLGTRDGMVRAAPTFIASMERARRLRMTGVQASATAFLAQSVLHGSGEEHPWTASVAGRDVATLVAEALELGEASVPVPWARCTLGIQAWLEGEDHHAVQAMESGLDPLRARQSQPQPPWWGFWALLRVATGQNPSAALDELATPSVQAHVCNRGAQAYGKGLLALQQGDRQAAADFIANGDTDLAPVPFMRHLYRSAIAPLTHTLDERRAEAWLREADAHFGAFQERALQHKVRAGLKAIGARRPRSAPGAVPPSLAAHGVTARETEVLRLVAAGKSNAEIAGLLVLSGRTVETHVSSLLTKTGCITRHELSQLLDAPHRATIPRQQ